MHNHFTHTPVCVLGDKRKQKRYFLLRDGSLMKVFLGNNLGYWLHLLKPEGGEILSWLKMSFRKQKCPMYSLIMLFFSHHGLQKKRISKLKNVALVSKLPSLCPHDKLLFKKRHKRPSYMIIFYSCFFQRCPAFVSVIMLAVTWLAQGHF